MKRNVELFDRNWERYDEWYDRHDAEYQLEMEAVGRALPGSGFGLEIGAGTGRFAAPLGVQVGLEPSPRMAQLGRRRGVWMTLGFGERLPFRDGVFDFVLMVVTICFVDDAQAVIRESARVLKPGGKVIIGFIDRDSELGTAYLRRAAQSDFYRVARFYTTGEVADMLKRQGLGEISYLQTLFPGDARKQDIAEGFGEGAFVVAAAKNDTKGTDDAG